MSNSTNLTAAIACQIMGRTCHAMTEDKRHPETNIWWQERSALYYKTARQLMGIEL